MSTKEKDEEEMGFDFFAECVFDSLKHLHVDLHTIQKM